MLDNTKFRIKDKTVINKLLLHSDFTPLYSRVNSLAKYKHKDIGAKLHFELEKEFINGQFVGYKHADLCISPHYHFNHYRHNGDDFTPVQATETIRNILSYLNINPDEYNALKVVNIEFGLNIIPDTDIKNIINGLYFYKRTPFKVGDFPYFKKTDATAYKQIKAYAKGLQFTDFPQYGINPNTFRFEVKSKQAKHIKKYGIETATDLLDLETYTRLGQTLLDDWENVLPINLTPDLTGLKSDEVQFIQNANKVEFWDDLKKTKHRNTFNLNKEKYFKILQGKNNLHTRIKAQIIDKLFCFQNVTNSTQKTPINREKVENVKTTATLINLENVTYHQNNKVCTVTGLDISMQKKGSKFLCLGGLKYYKENEPDTYKMLEEKYLTEKQKGRNFDRQIYFIAHNIRNAKTNPIHNPKYSRKRFEQRNYNPNQLQFNF